MGHRDDGGHIAAHLIKQTIREPLKEDAPRSVFGERVAYRRLSDPGHRIIDLPDECGRAQRTALFIPRGSDGIFADHTSYFASGSGRTWNFTIFGLEPLPPSWCQGVYIE
jgi:hypothetical protein